MIQVAPESEQQHGVSVVRPLAMLSRKRSFVETPARTKAPLLQPVAMKPVRWSTAAVPLAFLNTIERIEINHTRVRDGVTYYVLDVFLYHFNTRLPASLNNPRHAALSTLPVKADKPDYQVERRFSEFCRLRAQVYELVCMNPHYFCAHCHDFIAYVRFNPSQPRSLVKIAAGTEKRKAILSTFINDFLRMALSKEIQSRNCVPEDLVPHLMKQFLRDQDSSSSSRHS